MKSVTISRSVLYGAVGVVGIVVLWSFALVGSPSFNRKVSADRGRINNLQQIRFEIERYFEEHNKLPEKLAYLVKRQHWAGRDFTLSDPTTKRPYEYTQSEPYFYELCAEFELPSSAAELEQSPNRYWGNDDHWRHEAGHQCFKFNIVKGKRKK